MIGLSAFELRASAEAGELWQSRYRVYVLRCLDLAVASLPFDVWKRCVERWYRERNLKPVEVGSR